MHPSPNRTREQRERCFAEHEAIRDNAEIILERREAFVSIQLSIDSMTGQTEEFFATALSIGPFWITGNK